MKEVIRILNKELENRIELSKKNYALLQKQAEEIKQLKRENEILKNDLFELSKEHFKKDK